MSKTCPNCSKPFGTPQDTGGGLKILDFCWEGEYCGTPEHVPHDLPWGTLWPQWSDADLLAAQEDFDNVGQNTAGSGWLFANLLRHTQALRARVKELESGTFTKIIVHESSNEEHLRLSQRVVELEALTQQQWHKWPDTPVPDCYDWSHRPQSALLVLCAGHVYLANYWVTKGKPWWKDANCHHGHAELHGVTHWRPLPVLPDASEDNGT